MGSRWSLVSQVAAGLAGIAAGAIGAGPHAYTYTLSEAAILYGESEEPPPAGQAAYLALGSPREIVTGSGPIGAVLYELQIPLRGWVAPGADSPAGRFQAVLNLFEDAELWAQSARLTLGGTDLADALPVSAPRCQLLSTLIPRELRAWGRFDALLSIPYRRWLAPEET